jgi:hypothetical protein
MSPQTETKASVGFKAGVKDYKLTYYTPERSGRQPSSHPLEAWRRRSRRS